MIRRFAVIFSLMLAGCATQDAAVKSESVSGLAADPWYDAGRATIEARLAVTPNVSRAKNVILFVGDGMGVSTVTAGRIFDGQSRGATGEENVLAFETFPHTALVKTYNTNQQVADSAGTATALHTGVKTRSGVINIAAAARRGDCADSLGHHVPALGEIAERAGKATGIVTTARVTHATPATVYAHSPERDWESDDQMPPGAVARGCQSIAQQLIGFSVGDGLDVVLGGGRKMFTDAQIESWGARYPDGRFVTDRTALARAVESGADHVFGLFSASHLTYMLERSAESSQPTLSEMTARAIDLLSRNEDGFYLMVEGGRIDHGHHDGFAGKALAEVQEFSRAVETALDRVDLRETLILVTADHSHVFTMAGYPTRGNAILGLVHGNDAHGEPKSEPTRAHDGKPYTTLGYANGSGAVEGPRPEPATGLLARQQALVPFSSETHGGEDVALYAAGPWAHLAGGVIEQNVIFHIITHAFGWSGPESAGF